MKEDKGRRLDAVLEHWVLDTPAAEHHRKQPPPYGAFCITVPISITLRGRFPFPPFPIQDTSNPEDQSSWDSFKNMTPELSIVPGEQKDRMELHNKNWDSSSANTPDSSEGDFQTEV